MPEDEKTLPGTDLLNQGASDMAADRARRISSLHRSVDDLTQEQNRKRLQISTEVDALTKQQQKMTAQLEMERGDFTSETAQGYNTVLKGLGRTINSLATGVKTITVDTGKATTQAISQYGKAISEDISINKTNTIAMALSRATPLFGYFAAKFMETDVFQGAARKIKDKVGSAMSEGLSKAGHGIANIFKKGKDIVKEEREREPATVSDLEKLQQTIEGAAPKLQEGGYIKQGGMVEVHAAEVVTPIDKLLKQIDEAKSADISKKLDKTLSLMSQNLVKLETVVVERDEQQGSIVQTFIKEFQNVRDTKQEGHQKRLLRAILELKVGLIGMTSRMRIAWQRTLIQHPAFRNMLLFSDIMKSAIVSPIKFLFGVRGGYAGDVRGATQTHNVFLKISNILGMTYTTLMPKIDDLIIYTKAAAEALVGEEITPSKQVTYTMFDKIREALTGEKGIEEQKSFSEKMFDRMVEKLELDKGSMAKAGITGFGGFAHPGRVVSSMGVPQEATEKWGATKEWARSKYEQGKDTVVSELEKIRKLKEDQEEREGPHSPSMAENISKTAEMAEKDLKEGKKSDAKFEDLGKKGNKFAKEHLSETKGVRRRLRKLGSKTWDMIVLALGFLQNMMGRVINKFLGFLAPVLQFLGLKKLGTMAAGRAAKGAAGKAAAKGVAGKAATGAAKKGLAGRALGVGGKVLKFGGKLAGAGAGLLVGGAMGAWDAFSAMRDPEGFAGSILTRGLAGFLGGSDTGFAGATHGAMKGGALGAAIGSIVPGIGTLIGGGIGAAAGGILGFVGGKKISEGMSKTFGAIKDMVKGVWNIVIFPYKMLKEGLKSAWVLMKWGFKMTLGKVWESFKTWWEKPGLVQSAMKWIGGTMATIFGYIKMPFVWIGKKLKNMFGSDLLDKISKTVKVVLYNMMFPIVGMKKAYTYLKDKFIEKVSNLPIIGAIFKKVMSTVKDIHEGTLASKLESALNEPASTVPKPVPVPKGFDPSSVVQSVSTRRNNALENYMDTETKRFALDQESRKRGYNELSKQLGEKVDTGSKQTTAAIMMNTNVVASSNSNQMSTSSGGGGGAGPFSSGHGFAQDVTRCNIR